MKSTTQTVVFLVLLMIMVFAVTFASMYVRQTPTNPTAKKGEGPPALQLTFRRNDYPTRKPRLGELPELHDELLRSEFGVPAHFDFWFTNDNAQEVRLGLKAMFCQACSQARVFIAENGWRREAAASAALGKQSELMANLVLPVVVSAGADSSAWHDLEPKDEGVVVPPGAAGFVRLSWEVRRGVTGIKGLEVGAELWQQTPGTVTRLSVGVLLADPIHLDTKAVALDEIGRGESSSATLYCWSSTRLDFDFEARSVRDNALIVCRKERLTPSEIDELENLEVENARRLRTLPRPVLSGWRIVVTANERSKDGKRRLDEGRFVHRFTLVPANMRVEHPEVTVHGRVKGDIEVDGDGFIRLGQFKVSNGTSHQVTLKSERRELGLKLDKHPRFLKVSLDKEKPGVWRLSMTVEPNRVSGAFPRADNEAYRDSAIYLLIEGEGRRLRLPVSGEGLQ